MCGDNWRRLDSILPDVVETALMEAMRQDGAGVVHHPLNVPPPQSTHRDVLRLGVADRRGGAHQPRMSDHRTMEFDSGRPQTRGELAGRPPMRTGLEAPSAILESRNRSRLHPLKIDGPGSVSAECVSASLPTMSREKALVFAQPLAEPSPGSASVFSLLVAVVQLFALQRFASDGGDHLITKPLVIVAALGGELGVGFHAGDDFGQRLAEFIPLSNEGADGGSIAHGVDRHVISRTTPKPASRTMVMTTAAVTLVLGIARTSALNAAYATTMMAPATARASSSQRVRLMVWWSMPSSP